MQVVGDVVSVVVVDEGILIDTSVKRDDRESQHNAEERGLPEGKSARRDRGGRSHWAGISTGGRARLHLRVAAAKADFVTANIAGLKPSASTVRKRHAFISHSGLFRLQPVGFGKALLRLRAVAEIAIRHTHIG